MKKKLFLAVVFACILMIEVPAFGITLNANESATFMFDFGTASLPSTYSFNYNFTVTDTNGNNLNWYGSWDIYDELGQDPVYSGSHTTIGGTLYSATYGIGVGSSSTSAGLYDDPINYLKVTFVRGTNVTDTVANFNIICRATYSGGSVNAIASIVNEEPPTPTGVPEPASMLLLGLGLMGLAGVGRKLKK